MSDRAAMPGSYDADMSREYEILIDPDCRNGKHQSCIGDVCECVCHIADDAERAANCEDDN